MDPRYLHRTSVAQTNGQQAARWPRGNVGLVRPVPLCSSGSRGWPGRAHAIGPPDAPGPATGSLQCYPFAAPLPPPTHHRLSHPPAACCRELVQYEAQEAASSQQHEDEEAMVGAYRVLRTLGRGAFGRVVLGQRADGALAAIKLLPRGDRVRAEG